MVRVSGAKEENVEGFVVSDDTSEKDLPVDQSSIHPAKYI